MDFLPRRRRVWILILAIWMAFEPMVVPILHAGDLPEPKKTEFDPTSLDAVREAQDPDKVMSDMLRLQGVLPSDIKTNQVNGALAGKAYTDFLMMVSSAYDLMDEGSSDALTFFDAAKGVLDLSDIKDQNEFLTGLIKIGSRGGEGAESLSKFMESGSKKLFMFFGREYRAAEKGTWKKSALKFFTKHSNGARKFLPKFFDFLEHMAPPENITETRRYYRFFKGTPPGNAALNKAQAVATSIGIGLQILTIVVETTKIATNDDTHGTKQLSYENAKSGVNILLASAALVAMFLAAPVGTVIAIITTVVLIATYLLDSLGEYNKKWKLAYKRSYDYLMEADPTFVTFTKEKDRIIKERRSAAWIMADKKKARWTKDGISGDKIDKIYGTLLNQGVLVTYYAKGSLRLPKLDLNSLQDLWKKKADYMAWKPTKEEIEEKAKQSTFSKVLDAACIWNWPKKGVNKVMEISANSGMKKELESYPPVFFNPDFALLKRYQNFLMARKDRKGRLFDTVGLRMEQAPFNYIWLIALDSSNWDGMAMLKALEGDIFFCGVKEMQYLAKVMEEVVKKLDETKDKMDADYERAQKFCTVMKGQREALNKLLSAYDAEKNKSPDDVDWSIDKTTNPDRDKFWKVWFPCRDAFDWKADCFFGQNGQPAAKKMNAKNLIAEFKDDLEARLALIPHSIHQTIILMANTNLMIKNVLDRAALMEQLGKDREETLSKFDQDFAEYPALKKYLEENAFLGVGGRMDRIQNWLSSIAPAKKDMEHYTNRYMDHVKKYKEIGEALKSGQRGWIFKKTLPNAEVIVNQLNGELTQLKQTVRKIEDAKSDIDLEILVSTVDKEKLFDAVVLLLKNKDLVPMDPNADLAIDQINVGDD